MILKKLLLVRPDRAGDALKTLPALRALKARLSHWEISLLASEYNDSIFSFEPGLRLSTLPSHWLKLPESELKRVIADRTGGEFDIAVCLPCDATPELKKIAPLLPAKNIYSVAETTGTQLRFPTGTPAGNDERENIAYLIGTAIGIPLTAKGVPNAPVLSAMDRQEALEHLAAKRGKWIALCPFASDTQRSFSPRMLTTVMNTLTEKPELEYLILPGGPSDFDRLEAMKKLCAHPEKVRTVFPSCFRALGAYFERCDGLIGVDSGPLHLASAMGLPALGFTSGCDMARWYPETKLHSKFIRRGFFGRFPTIWVMKRAVNRWAVTATASEISQAPWQTPIPVLF